MGRKMLTVFHLNMSSDVHVDTQKYFYIENQKKDEQENCHGRFLTKLAMANLYQ